jgi:hypothetical protein
VPTVEAGVKQLARTNNAGWPVDRRDTVTMNTAARPDGRRELTIEEDAHRAAARAPAPPRVVATCGPSSFSGGADIPDTGTRETGNRHALVPAHRAANLRPEAPGSH